MSLEAGQMLENRYRIVRAIKKGGMGAVYEAQDTRLDDEPVALKEMLDFSQEEDAAFIRSKFQEEKRLLSRLNFPGIPRVRDFFMLERICYIVMDLVSGVNLEQEINDRFSLAKNPPSLAEIVDTGTQVLGILEHLHHLDPPLVHRDVKPGNIIRDHLGRLWLVDFGLAMNFTGTARSEVGTLGYAPLEQIAGQAEPRSDLFALGATLFHFATGKTPVAFSIPPFREASPQAAPELAEVIDKSVRNKPDERFQNAAEMAQALRSLTAPSPVRSALAASAPPPLLSAPPTARLEDPGRPVSTEEFQPKARPRIFLIVCLLVGGVVVLGSLSKWRRHSHASKPSASPTRLASATPLPSTVAPSHPTPLALASGASQTPVRIPGKSDSVWWTAQDEDQPGLPGHVAPLEDGTQAFIPEGWENGTHLTDKKVEFPYIKSQSGSDWGEVNWIDRGCMLPAAQAIPNDAKNWARHFSGQIVASRSGEVTFYDITYKVPKTGRGAYAQLLYQMPQGPGGHRLTVAHLMTANPDLFPFWRLRALALSRK